MPKLYLSETDEEIGEISRKQLQFLMDHLEEESIDDGDYYITLDTLELLEDEDADESLIALLSNAIGAEDGIEIYWTE